MKIGDLEVNEVQPISHTWGIAGFACSLFGLVGFLMPYLGLPLSIMGVVGYYKQKRLEATGLAMAGNVMGIIGIVINGVMLLLFVLGVMFITAFANL